MKIIVYDVAASETGALTVLQDYYNRAVSDKDNKYVFIVSIANLSETANVRVISVPKVKRSWIDRIVFEEFHLKKIVSRLKPDKVLSLQDKALEWYQGHQDVYLHDAFCVSNYRINIVKDGFRPWFYRYIKSIINLRSYKSVDSVIVQTEWMKKALLSKSNLKQSQIVVQPPNIDLPQVNRQSEAICNRFFYPASGYNYKNHWTLLRAIRYAVNNLGLKDYELILTLDAEESRYTKKLYEYCKTNRLNIRFAGALERKKVFENYTTKVLVFPSYIESYGLPLAEARSVGATIVASDTDFSKELLNGYNRAFFFAPFDEIQLGNILYRLASGKEKGI